MIWPKFWDFATQDGRIVLDRLVLQQTNKSLEAFNRVIKEVMADHRKLPFGDYAEALFVELRRRSEESRALFISPKTPRIPQPLVSLSQCLSDNFDDYFQEYEGQYFIKDRFEKIKILSRKVENKEIQEIGKFLSFYAKPSFSKIKSYLYGESKLRNQSLNLASIRRLKLNIVQDDNNFILLSSFCNCLIFFLTLEFVPTCSILIQKKCYDVSINFKKPKVKNPPWERWELRMK